ncbi:hypothetical protein ACFFQF_25190 [Haladaptatus pallidirubidus]|uniref:DUF8119 domain-containing protein n=1 Tax=Haladaptatus pallidirubidus TaxID=1008152 RepID=A0AAV3UKD7_9EURY|nr:hypothetical protein [Haladaptatus pallidirubidus]
MSNVQFAGTVLDHVKEHRSGMVADLAFAVIWVAVVTALFDVLQGPTWAYHLTLFAGVVGYFAFFMSLESALDAES